MNKLITLLLVSVFATASFAASHVGAPMTGASAAKMPEAMKSGSHKAQAKAEAKAEAKHLKKAHTGKKNSTDEQMKKDAVKL